jgi:hypothetical protein
MANFAGFIGPSYAARAFQADAEESWNWFAEAIESQGGRTKTTYTLLSKPGFQKFARVAGALAIRAECALNQRGFFIAQTGVENHFYELKADGAKTDYGTLAGDRRPQIVPGLTQILILAGGLGYVFDLKANSLARITDPDFPIGAVKGGFLDGEFIVLEPHSQTFAISALNDATSWDPLDFGDVEGEPGNITTFLVDHRQIWFLGNNHSEIYVDSGNALFPFVRLDGAFMEQGAGESIDGAFRCDNTIFWLGGNADGQGIFWRANGYTPQRISTHAIEKLVATFGGDLSRVSGYPYQGEGHTFARWDFPDAYGGRGASLLYDCAGGLWHRRGFWNAKLGQYMGDLARTHMFVFGKHLVGDWRSGTIYEQSMDFYSDDGAAIRRLRAAPDLANGGKWTFYPEFRLLMDVGVGLDGAAVTPENGIYDFHDLDWNWTNVLGAPNACPPPSADPPGGVGFGPPWFLSSMRLFYNEHAAANVTLTITGVGGSYGPTVLNIPSGPDGLTVNFDPPLELDDASVLTASEEAGLEVQADIFMTLSSTSDGDIPEGGAPAGDGTDPQIILQWSNDGGKTWSAERPTSAGKIGDYKRLVRWRQTPRSNNRAYRVIYSEPTDASLVAAEIDTLPGN